MYTGVLVIMIPAPVLHCLVSHQQRETQKNRTLTRTEPSEEPNHEYGLRGACINQVALQVIQNGGVID